jgi:hypothetical protein
MPIRIQGETCCGTAELCQRANTSRHTAFKWWNDRMLCGEKHWDWWGWRLFTAAQVGTVRVKNRQVFATSQGS